MNDHHHLARALTRRHFLQTSQAGLGAMALTNLLGRAAMAAPETPVSIADSYELPGEFSEPEPGWTLTGGTSVSSPLMAGAMALAGYTFDFRVKLLPWPLRWQPALGFAAGASVVPHYDAWP